MKKILLIIQLLILTASFTLYSQTPRNQNSKDFAIMVHATIDETKPNITLHWQNLSDTKSIEIYRKLKSESKFNLITTLDSGNVEFTDNNIQIGIPYEYQILANSIMLKRINDTTSAWMPYYATGYAYAGIKIPPPELGKVLLIVEQELSDNIYDQLNQLINDIKKEGWDVIVRYAPRTEKFDGLAVKNVKSIILEEYNKDLNNLTTVFLLGRIAVPYSGNFSQAGTYPPDGHVPDHNGAWPCDLYYGFIDESIWTDNIVNNTTGKRTENHNVPGDGKFDVTTYQYQNVKLKVGRVDLYNLPAFFDEQNNKGSELDLILNYLEKNHKYRTGEINYVNKAKVYDGFSTMEEGFASSGWRNFATFFGAENVSSGNWIISDDTTTYLWAYACSGGMYTGFGNANAGRTTDFANDSVNAVFTLLFGSYFGDWDYPDAFLRAPLASKPSALTCAWSGRPHWYLHYMGLGEPIGSAFLLSANNYTEYLPNLYYNSQYQQWYIYAFGMKTIHIALMGDPTLRMNYSIVPPPFQANTTQIDDRKIKITWSAPEGNYDGFYIYRAIQDLNKDNPISKYERLNDFPIKENSFIDSTIVNGNLYYKIYSVKLIETIGSGSYYTQSQSAETHSVVTNVTEIPELQFETNITPIPATIETKINISLKNSSFVNIKIYDLKGNEIKTICNNFVDAGKRTFIWNLLDDKGNLVNNAIYLAKISDGHNFKVEKIIVNR